MFAALPASKTASRGCGTVVATEVVVAGLVAAGGSVGESTEVIEDVVEVGDDEHAVAMITIVQRNAHLVRLTTGSIPYQPRPLLLLPSYSSDARVPSPLRE